MLLVLGLRHQECRERQSEPEEVSRAGLCGRRQQGAYR